GGLGIYWMGQYFGGRSVPLAGIAGVGVAPHARARGVARALVHHALDDARARKVPIAGLYPATQRVYRSVGFEQAGEQIQYEIPLAALNGRFEVEVSPIPDLPAAIAGLKARYRPVHGNLDRSPAIWDRLARPYTGRRFGWWLGDDGYAI